MLTKQLIIKKTLAVAHSTLASRLLGLIRETLMLNYLAPGMITDAFITAFKIPNSLRKIFAEGALSAALVPRMVYLIKQGKKHEISSLISLSGLVFEGTLLMLCMLIFWKAEGVIYFIAPGFYINGHALDSVTYAVSFLRILIALILFLSSSALLASALQATNRFFVPAISQVLINVVFITGLIVCMLYQLPVNYLCFFILIGCFLPFVLHLSAYFNAGFSFGPITQEAWINLRHIMVKFLPCLLSMSVMEIHLFIDTSLGSYLPEGSLSLIYYANRFMGIPLGVFAVAFSTILLPHFSHLSTYARSRLSFYILESAKLIAWVTIPVSLFFAFSAQHLFATLSSKFSPAQITDASIILSIFVTGLFFFSFNKILLNVYYALHNTSIPFIISFIVTVLNFGMSYFFFMPWYGSYGIALATTIAGIAQTILFLLGLEYHFKLTLYVVPFARFLALYTVQIAFGCVLFMIGYLGMQAIIPYLPTFIATTPLSYWITVLPIAALVTFIGIRTRTYSGLKLYFLD